MFPKLLDGEPSVGCARDRPVIVAPGQNRIVIPKPNTTAKDLVVIVCASIPLGLRRVRRWQALAKEHIERVDESPCLPREVFVDLPNIHWSWRVESVFRPRARRGCAFADFNNDGLIDVVTTSLNEPTEL